jgi:chromosomal replication initiator protein
MQPGRPATGQTSCAPTSATTTGRDLGAISFEEHADHDQAVETETAAPANFVSTPATPGDVRRLIESVWSDAAWNEAILNAVGARNFAHWFRGRTSVTVNTAPRSAPSSDSLETGDVDAGECLAVTIGVSSPFFLNWMHRQFREAARDAARAVLGADVSVQFVVDEAMKASPATAVDTPQTKATSTANAANASRSPRGQAVGAQSSSKFDRSFSVANSVRSMTGPTRLGLVVPLTDSSRTTISPPKPSSETSDNARRETAAARRPPFGAPAAGSRPRHTEAAEEANAPGQQPRPASTPLPMVSAARVVPAASTPRAGVPLNERPRTETAEGGRLSRKLAELTDFVTGPGNELAVTAVQQLCDAPGSRINPLFLYGGVGIGKTHLLEGICRRVRRAFPHLQVMLLSAEAFANHFTEALRQRTLPAFRQRFRTVDILLVDDVEFFEGKQVIQEEFLHTFKQLEALGRQLVVTADRHPRILTRLSDDLISRFQSGLVCRIENPDLETRRRIATAKAGRLDADFAPEAVAYVAQRFTNSVRELEGALQSLATWHAMTGRRVTATAARTVLADMERDCVRIVRVGDVEQAVCRFFGLAADDLRSSRRNRTLSQPRMLAMFLSRKLTQAAYSEIGQHFGGRNHSTVMSAEKKVQEWLTTGSPIRVASQTWPLSDLLESLEQQLRAG